MLIVTNAWLDLYLASFPSLHGIRSVLHDELTKALAKFNAWHTDIMEFINGADLTFLKQGWVMI
ncbi:MAG: hypothetical protein DI539_21205 [Flavobacterium psychrophilum]|jgi:hypothetical protein|nr:MAG: hypothetical protein DI539_21205 [Flavobacterium psychrophilum]